VFPCVLTTRDAAMQVLLPVEAGGAGTEGLQPPHPEGQQGAASSRALTMTVPSGNRPSFLPST